MAKIEQAVSGRQPEWWTCDPDAERLTSDSVHEAVLAWWDALPSGDPVPETVTVYGFAPMQPDAAWLAEHALEDLIERLDEEYGDPEATSYCDQTDAMKAAARAFVDAVLVEYRMWACEPVCEETVKVADYLEGGSSHD